MDEIFNPSLLISLGPSSKKALLYAKKLLSNIPESFSGVIDFYDAQDIKAVTKDIQQVIDTKLLSAKALNKLVDMGYKVRSENISAVRMNIYIFWELYETAISVLEIIRLLTELNYGNIDKAQHSGVSIYVIPILDKEWTIEENQDTEALQELKQLKEFFSQRENMLRIDSKIYLLHSITSDGTRIPKEELLYVSAVIVYLNTIPSKEPPLSNYNKRVLMHEGGYKLGTIGITSLMVFKEKLREDFSLYIANKIIEQAISMEDNLSVERYSTSKFIDLKAETELIKGELSCIDKDESLILGEKEELNFTKNISEYPDTLKTWKSKIELDYIPELKIEIMSKVKNCIADKISRLDEELDTISVNFSLMEGLCYLNGRLGNIKAKARKQEMSKQENLIELDNKLKARVEACTNLTSFIVKGLLFAVLLSTILIGFIIPHTSGFGTIISVIAFVLINLGAIYLYYYYKLKLLHSFVKEYEKEVLKSQGRLISDFVESSILKEYEAIKTHILEKKKAIEEATAALRSVGNSLRLKENREDNILGNLTTELLNNEDKQRLFREIPLALRELYKSFVNKLGGYKAISEEASKEKLLEISIGEAGKLKDLDFYDYFKFKYKDNDGIEFNRWIDTALIKSKQLLQYVNTNLEEEHLTLIASPNCLKLLKQSEDNKIYKLNFSPTASEHINNNCMAVVRICIGLPMENIVPIRNKLKE